MAAFGSEGFPQRYLLAGSAGCYRVRCARKYWARVVERCRIAIGEIGTRTGGRCGESGQLRQLAEDRILDARHLLDGSRWSGAYYLAGYAVECGLKACIMVYVETSGAIFQDKKYSERCWTHDLEDLLALANLRPSLDAEADANAALFVNWAVAKDWKETSRYEQKTQPEAQAMYDAVADNPDGVLEWIRKRW